MLGKVLQIAPSVKKCGKCKEEKPLEEFSNSTHGVLGKQPYCKICDCADKKERTWKKQIKKYGENEALRRKELRIKNRKCPEGYKICSSCKRVLALTEFTCSSGGWRGRVSACRSCYNSYEKRYLSLSPRNRLNHNLATAKMSSKRKKFPCEITIEFLTTLWDTQAGRCFYTGTLMSYLGEGTPESVSIDRVDSSKGYLRSNVVLCCAYVNRMKGDRSFDEFMRWCRLVIDHSQEVHRE
jgi:hypothetical protein